MPDRLLRVDAPQSVEPMSFQASLNGSTVRPTTAPTSSRREMSAGAANPDQTLKTTSTRVFNVGSDAASPAGGRPTSASAYGAGALGAYTPSPKSRFARVEGIATNISRPPSHPDVLQYRYHNRESAKHTLDATRPTTPVTTQHAPAACKQSFAAATGDYYRNLHHGKSSNVFY